METRKERIALGSRVLVLNEVKDSTPSRPTRFYEKIHSLSTHDIRGPFMIVMPIVPKVAHFERLLG